MLSGLPLDANSGAACIALNSGMPSYFAPPASCGSQQTLCSIGALDAGKALRPIRLAGLRPIWRPLRTLRQHSAEQRGSQAASLGPDAVFRVVWRAVPLPSIRDARLFKVRVLGSQNLASFRPQSALRSSELEGLGQTSPDGMVES